MTTKKEIAFWEMAKTILTQEIHEKHGITEMDIACGECKAALMVAFINDRINTLMYV